MPRMVAPLPPPAAVPPPSALAGRGGLVRFTVDDVLALIRQGLVAEDASAERLDGKAHLSRFAFSKPARVLVCESSLVGRASKASTLLVRYATGFPKFFSKLGLGCPTKT